MRVSLIDKKPPENREAGFPDGLWQQSVSFVIEDSVCLQ